jgi:hypothetical protein
MIKKSMAVLVLVVILGFLGTGESYGQFKDRTSSYSYAGAGYSLVFFTDGDVSETYPAFDLNSGSFITEIGFFYGMRLSPPVAVEIAPSFIFTNSKNNDGFYFTNRAGERNYYFPNEASLFALPVNLNLKIYPFFADPLTPLGNMYIGAGAGMMYLSESFNNSIYADSNLVNFQRFAKSENSLWTPNYKFFLGFGTSGKFGYAFEVGYRFVPLDGDGTKPQTTSLAKNFNSVNVSAKVMFSF